MIKRVLTLVNATHIAASVFINDDESGLHHDYEPFGKLRIESGWRSCATAILLPSES